MAILGGLKAQMPASLNTNAKVDVRANADAVDGGAARLHRGNIHRHVMHYRKAVDRVKPRDPVLWRR